jgi:glycosyltransferase involved in cell wall biosynthesis
LIRRLGLEVGKDIYITGHVEDEELALLYAACDVFVLPSYHESFSVAVTEAMAFGKPVIVSPIAGDPIVEDCVEGFIIKPYDINSFTEALTTILSDRKLYNHMSEKAACKAKLYLWKNCALKLYEVYEKVLLERKTGRH